jgi:hypothetical protein
MKVVIVVPGTYNDERGQPVTCEKGDILATAAGYGQTLLDESFARPLLTGAAVPEPEPEPVDEPASPKPKRQKKAT